MTTLNVQKFDQNDSNHTAGCIKLENPEEHVAVFAFNREKEMIYGHPLNTSDSIAVTKPTTGESTSEPGISIYNTEYLASLRLVTHLIRL